MSDPVSSSRRPYLYALDFLGGSLVEAALRLRLDSNVNVKSLDL